MKTVYLINAFVLAVMIIATIIILIDSRNWKNVWVKSVGYYDNDVFTKFYKMNGYFDYKYCQYKIQQHSRTKKTRLIYSGDYIDDDLKKCAVGKQITLLGNVT
jgi:hypothetical protein